jgi:small-conductance mechanosensitive channel
LQKNVATILRSRNISASSRKQEINTMATAKKPAAKAAPKKSPVSKTAKAIAKISASIAKLTERKDKLGAEIKALRDQRAALKAAPVTVAGPAAKKAAKAAPAKKAAKK